LKRLKSVCFQLSTKMSVCGDRQAVSLQALLGHMVLYSVPGNLINLDERNVDICNRG
jgi:hypothetical protein